MERPLTTTGHRGWIRGGARRLCALSQGGLLLLFLAAPAGAAPVAGDPLYGGAKTTAKVARSLLVAGQQRAAAALATSPDVEVDVRLRRLTPEIEARARRLGLAVAAADYRNARLAGTCDPGILPALAAIPEVAVIHPNYGAQLMTGAVNSQGDASIGADAARASFGVDGSGVRVGILSDSFVNPRLGIEISGEGCERVVAGSASQTGGELPPAVGLLAGGRTSGSDEGRAMAEVVHDLAPGATILFRSAFDAMTDFSTGIDALVACGVDVLVDDVLYYAEPMFQDGIIAQAAQRAVDAGIPFFSALGNLSTFGVDDTYRDFSPEDDMETPPTGADFHVFASGSRFAAIELPPHCGVRFVLQWNEPFSGALGAGAVTDLDLYECSQQDPAFCSAGNDSRNPQGCAFGEGDVPSGDPLEILRVRNDGIRPATRYIAIDHVCGDKNVRFRIAAFADGCFYPGGYNFDPQIFHAAQAYGHPTAAGVVGLGAIFYGEIDSAGTHTPPEDRVNVEGFSSLGGDIPFYFDSRGRRFTDAPRLRRKPELAAPDGVNTSFFGLRDEEDDGFLNFFGTSAAAPHAAAVAALMLERRPHLTPQTVLGILRNTAIDVEEPGEDFLTGAGLIDAVAAVEGALALPTATPTRTSTPSPTPSRTPTQSPTASATPLPGSCPGDCDGDGEVSVAELVRGVRIALGLATLDTCESLDQDRNGSVSIDELIRAAGSSLQGC